MWPIGQFRGLARMDSLQTNPLRSVGARVHSVLSDKMERKYWRGALFCIRCDSLAACGRLFRPTGPYAPTVSAVFQTISQPRPQIIASARWCGPDTSRRIICITASHHSEWQTKLRRNKADCPARIKPNFSRRDSPSPCQPGRVTMCFPPTCSLHRNGAAFRLANCGWLPARSTTAQFRSKIAVTAECRKQYNPHTPAPRPR